MITKLKILKPKYVPIRWWKDVQALKARKVFTFGNGITLLVGPNGSGKSTVLALLQRILHCEQGYSSTITHTSIDEIVSMGAPKRFDEKPLLKLSEILSLTHDGQATYSIVSGRTVGLMGGSFDDDFFKYGLNNTMEHLSMGESAIRELVRVMDEIKKSKGKIEYKTNQFTKESTRYQYATEILNTPTCPVGKLTLIMDEPTDGMDIVNQFSFWNQIEKLSKTCQIIVATHDLIPILKFKEASIIEFQHGYVETIKQNIQKMTE